jgi:hypothetical protein
MNRFGALEKCSTTFSVGHSFKLDRAFNPVKAQIEERPLMGPCKIPENWFGRDQPTKEIGDFGVTKMAALCP